MIDVHSHIVFEVDDGAKSIEQSLEILQEAKEAGFTDIILTPHYIEGYYDNDAEIINNKIAKLQSLQNDVNLHSGNEIYITENIMELISQKKAQTLAGSRYVLFELPLNAEALNLNRVVYSILGERKIPVLAHPERYPEVQKDPNMLIPLINEGIILQSNYGSIVGQYGKEAKNTIKKMLNSNMVHLLGSDVHRPGTICWNIEEAKNKIAKIVGEAKLEELTTINPGRILKNEVMDIDEPIKVKKGWF